MFLTKQNNLVICIFKLLSNRIQLSTAETGEYNQMQNYDFDYMRFINNRHDVIPINMKPFHS